MIKKDKKEVELIQVNNMLEVGGKIDRKDNAFDIYISNENFKNKARCIK